MLLKLSKTGKGLKVGIYESTIGVGFFLSTFISGIVGQWNAANPYLFSSIITGISFVVLFTLYLNKEQTKNPKIT